MRIPTSRVLMIVVAFAGIVPPSSSLVGQVCDAPEFRQFDFWLGSWKIEQEILTSDGRYARYPASNRVEKAASGCALVEHWSGRVLFYWDGMTEPDTLQGLSVRSFDPVSRQWKIYWLDSRQPSFGEPFVGTFEAGEEGKGTFVRRLTRPDGAVSLSRITFERTGADAVEWSLDISSDDGASWTTIWRMHFRRDGSAPPTDEASTPSGAIPASAGPFDLTEVAPGVLAAVLRPDAPSYAFSNSLVVVGEDGALVVDTQQDPAAARSLLAAVRGWTDVPVRWVVNTHWHLDHVLGNEVYRDAFPRSAVVAHRTTRTMLLERGEAEIEKQKASVEQGIEARRGWLARGEAPGGAPLTEADRESLRRSLAFRSAYLRELDSVRLVLPDMTFEDGMELDLGGRTVQLLHVGPAHTPGDIVLYLPDSGILAAGDVVEEGTLWLQGADIHGWARGLKRLRELDVSTVLPGHGGLSRGRTILDVQGRFLEAVVAWAREAQTDRALPSGDSPRGCDPGVAIPGEVATFQGAFAAWGVDADAFEKMAREACRMAVSEEEGGSASPT